jgi:hypothetical protein
MRFLDEINPGSLIGAAMLILAGLALASQQHPYRSGS